MSSDRAPTPATPAARGSSVASHGSRTVVADAAPTPPPPPPAGILHLRAAASRPQPAPRVQWADDTVDNEHLGRKRSKVCCIYHRQRRFDESGSDSECDSASDSDGPNAYERMPHARRRQ
ncbi:Type 1 phosphatases regulator ypi1 [Coemansia sp. RSA 2711]|nr:Type 1 phosphatases regulator ypi1 [Coemansia sp. RSA 2711]KAJ1848330.1 Type 1 phosphatases regulator ypi1 [Coemansia sp. RSA 2708]KAJ2310268.1 Type 1 phosphatases regulator ypi1 [Coemansia sp. RSA 2705]KAJ2318186.1 Type 1 phosphatases regulator ypi1 [Coemansia sp. RSA 2704]KAJ2361778.1 Type 1 phosphatases regulator ypi1 [Coemansia sp. RSA 2610]KAJ2390447.1 Type 1 phosphatases regulator ypi1 [Coemansia sp. RSA 2611]KAJ2737662.1 Type 1 phosphatases regulator ypi1 [Coemansia sp. Cherry 401B]